MQGKAKAKAKAVKAWQGKGKGGHGKDIIYSIIYYNTYIYIYIER